MGITESDMTEHLSLTPKDTNSVPQALSLGPTVEKPNSYKVLVLQKMVAFSQITFICKDLK